MKEIKPDVLILSGNLSFNGAKASHEGLAAKLKAIEDSGVSVLVMPGNHDLYSRIAACFEGDDYTLVDNVSAGTFFNETSTMMLKRSIKEASEKECEFFSDVNSAYFSGRRDTIEWDEEVCREITEKSAFVGLYLKSVYDDGFSDDTRIGSLWE